MPSNAKLLPYRSNIPYLAEYCLTPCDPDFPKRAKENNGGFIVGGSNYGQGSSREHAALAPLQLGSKRSYSKVICKDSHGQLNNSSIIPMTFENEGDYDEIDMGDEIVIENIIEQIKSGNRLIVKNKTKNKTYQLM